MFIENDRYTIKLEMFNFDKIYKIWFWDMILVFGGDIFGAPTGS